ncbi:MAG: redox-sensing transcriptional repressor Rex [Erysipelotrichaceae bacterium]|nr:redox-sensing transcriptional repressor Rex [Erysipelotrichaceae bacterium]
MEEIKSVSMKQLERYPVYLKYLISIKDQGITSISAPMIAKALDCTEEQVRKDLQIVSPDSGKPKSGRDIKTLINDIENFLGYNDVSDAIVVGVGHLGEAFMRYKGFSEFGLNVLAGFDLDETKIGKKVDGKEIFSMDKMSNLISRLKVNIAILTVPSDAANAVSKLLVSSGIKAIWNFAPIHLDVPEDIVVENVNLASSLAVLSHKLNKKILKENK